MSFTHRLLPIIALFAQALSLLSTVFVFEKAHANAWPTGLPDEHILSVMPPLKFAVDERMKRNVDFWISIYTQYTTRQGLIHDAKFIDHVYEVLELDDSSLSTSRTARKARNRWKQVLLDLHKKCAKLPPGVAPENMNADEAKVFEMYRDINEPDKFLQAAHRKRIRFQLGQKDRYLEGLIQSGRYLPAMEEIFKKEGLPVELTRLPFVESSFNVRARSKVGASGIWQFMRSTGRLFLRINADIDERNDPIRATEAASQLLKLNYASLGTWPLAVTAYNHGRKGMMKAVRRVGSEELEDLVSEYRGHSFGFASTNFFTELLAAIEVEKNADQYFGKVERAKPVPYFEALLPDGISIRKLATYLKVDVVAIRDLNPGLSESCLEGSRKIPAGYQLRLPFDGQLTREAAARIFLAGFQQIPDLYKVKGHAALKYVKSRRPSEDVDEKTDAGE
jgi:membrane-bound lytic murein transglycosylase D